MKKIEAFVKPHRLDEVTLAVHRINGVTGMSVVDARGWGHGKQQAAAHDHAERTCDFEPHTKIEIVCSDALVENVIQTIQQAAHTGLAGDGSIFVCNVEQRVRISTGERSTDAL